MTLATGTTSVNSVTFNSTGAVNFSPAVSTATLSLANSTSTLTVSAASGGVTFNTGVTLGVANTVKVFVNGTSTLSLAGGVFFSSASTTLTLTGSGATTISGVVNGTGSNLLFKTGTGTLTLSGTNGANFATTLNGGTLLLDYSTNNNSKLSDQNSLRLGGGSIVLLGGSHPEIVSGSNVTTLYAGGATTISRTSGTSTLAMNTVSVTAGATLNFASAGFASMSNANVNAILGSYATVAVTGSADWASGGALIAAYNSYTTFITSGGSSSANYLLTDSSTVAASESAYTLKINTAHASQSLDVGPSNTLTLFGGGLMFVGADAYEIKNGTLNGTTNLVIQQWGLGSLKISSVISNASGATSLTKTGTGTLILANANSYTGITYLNQGTASISSNSNLGAVATGASVFINGAPSK